MNYKKMKTIIFDIDGTLSLVGDRVKCLEENDWDSFYERCGEDMPNQPIFDLLEPVRYWVGHAGIYFLTGRRESVRTKTHDWLKRWGFPPLEGHLLMRKDGDHRHDTVVKPELIREAGIDPYLIFEDRNSMVKKWRELGYTCLQVAEGDF